MTVLLFAFQYQSVRKTDDRTIQVSDSTSIDSLISELPEFDVPEGYYVQSAGYSVDSKYLKLLSYEAEGQMIVLTESEDKDLQGVTTFALQQVSKLMSSFTAISSRDTSYMIDGHEYDFIYSEGFQESEEEMLYEYFGFFNDLENPLLVIAYGPVKRWNAQQLDKFIISIQLERIEL